MQSQSQMKQMIDYVHPEQINNRYICTICSDIVKNPTKLPCNHFYCLPCVERWIRENGSCPSCRAQVNKNIRLRIDDQVELEVENLMIFCPHHPERCTWKGLRREYDAHKKVCNYHMIPKSLAKPIGKDDPNFDEKRHLDPGSLMARLLDKMPDAEKQYSSNLFFYMADCKGGDGAEEKQQIKRAAQKLSQRTADLKKSYPGYFPEQKIDKILKSMADKQETEQIKANNQSKKAVAFKQNEKKKKSRAQKRMDNIDARIKEAINLTKQRILQRKIDGRNRRNFDDEEESDYSFSESPQRSFLQQFQDKKYKD